VFDRISVKRRQPAVAPVASSSGWGGDVVAVVGGLVVYAALVLFLHERLIGVAPMPGGGF
jgi:uncharacterized membrane protein